MLGWDARGAGSGFRRSLRCFLGVKLGFDFRVRHRENLPRKILERLEISHYVFCRVRLHIHGVIIAQSLVPRLML